jgi:hypothetical protein
VIPYIKSDDVLACAFEYSIVSESGTGDLDDVYPAGCMGMPIKIDQQGPDDPFPAGNKAFEIS